MISAYVCSDWRSKIVNDYESTVNLLVCQSELEHKITCQARWPAIIFFLFCEIKMLVASNGDHTLLEQNLVVMWGIWSSLEWIHVITIIIIGNLINRRFIHQESKLTWLLWKCISPDQHHQKWRQHSCHLTAKQRNNQSQLYSD